MPDKSKLANDYIEQAISSRKEFDTFDNDINASVNRIMNAFATLAEQKPEEVFGISPSARDKFFISRLLDPQVLRAMNESPEGLDTLDIGDITGSNPALIGLIGKIASSESGAKIVEELFHHIRAEKDFFKETGKEIIGGIGQLFD